MARNVRFSLLRGGGSSLEVLYGKVSLTPTNLHTLSTTAVLPAPTTFDLVNGVAVATNVAPTPAPVDGAVAWAYKVKVTDTYGKSWEYLVGVPDGTTEINFNVLPRYTETRPPAFGQGPAGPAGQSATIAIGTTTSGPTPAVSNSGTSTDAVLNFTLPKGDKGDTGAGVILLSDGERVATDPPSLWAPGTSIMQVGATQYGWPTNHGVVTTTKRFSSGRAVTQFANSNGRVWERTATFSGDTWNTFREVAFSDLATPLLNGLMPATDKAKLDGMTPAANTKTFAALASTYQTGFSTLQVRAADGWPIATTGTVVTQKNASGNGGVGQWLYSVEGGTPLYRVSDAAGAWGAFQTLASEASVWGLPGVRNNYDIADSGADMSGTTDSSLKVSVWLGQLPSGATVLQYSGTLLLRTRVVVTKPTVFRGLNIKTSEDEVAFEVKSSSVEFSKCAFLGSGHTAYKPNSELVVALGAQTSPLKNIIISDSTFSDTRAGGIRLEWCTESQVTGNVVEDFVYGGIMLYSVRNSRVTKNIVRRAHQPESATLSYGIAVTDRTNDAAGRSSDVVVALNELSEIRGWEGIDTHGGLRISVIGNSIRNVKHAINLVQGANSRAFCPEQVTVVGNTIDASDIVGWSSGIALSGKSDNTLLATGTITGNTINATKAPLAMARVDWDKTNVSGNTPANANGDDSGWQRVTSELFYGTWTSNSTSPVEYRLKFVDGVRTVYFRGVANRGASTSLSMFTLPFAYSTSQYVGAGVTVGGAPGAFQTYQGYLRFLHSTDNTSNVVVTSSFIL